jgi:hypothetical protein
MGEVKAYIETRAGHKFTRLAADVLPEVQQSQREMADDAEIIFAAYAPKGASSRVARSIHTTQFGWALEVVADAKNPLTGYAYVGVTRFGHKMQYIYPRKDRRASRVLSTRRARQRGTQAALRLELGPGLVIFRRRIKAYRPAVDWADEAMPSIRREAETVGRRLGERLMVRFLG